MPRPHEPYGRSNPTHCIPSAVKLCWRRPPPRLPFHSVLGAREGVRVASEALGRSNPTRCIPSAVKHGWRWHSVLGAREGGRVASQALRRSNPTHCIPSAVKHGWRWHPSCLPSHSVLGAREGGRGGKSRQATPLHSVCGPRDTTGLRATKAPTGKRDTCHAHMSHK